MITCRMLRHVSSLTYNSKQGQRNIATIKHGFNGKNDEGWSVGSQAGKGSGQ